MLPPIADRFVAGESSGDALDRARDINGEGLGAILNLLGEHYADPQEAADDAATYCQLIKQIDSGGLDACISVKPTQLGLAIGRTELNEHLDRIADVAQRHDVFVWLDMEDHDTTDATLNAYERLVDQLGANAGVCVQANLKRTAGDVERLAGSPGKVRLVKGAYKEPPDIAHRDPAAVDRSFRSVLEYMFEHFEDGIAVASHDPHMVDLAADLHDQYGTPFEYQMLMGVREGAQRELAADHRVFQYVPYGSRWFSYFARRVAERRENLGFALRAIAGTFR